MNEAFVNTDALFRAAEYCVGLEVTHDILELADLLDNVERDAHAKAFDEGYGKGHEAGYAKGYTTAISDSNELDQILADTADAAMEEAVTAHWDDYLAKEYDFLSEKSDED